VFQNDEAIAMGEQRITALGLGLGLGERNGKPDSPIRGDSLKS
jgi:hypothetical protein